MPGFAVFVFAVFVLAKTVLSGRFATAVDLTAEDLVTEDLAVTGFFAAVLLLGLRVDFVGALGFTPVPDFLSSANLFCSLDTVGAHTPDTYNEFEAYNEPTTPPLQ